MKMNYKKRKVINRLVSTALAATLLVTGVPIPEFEDGFHFNNHSIISAQIAEADDTEPAGIVADLFDQSTTITLDTTEKLKNFSWWYNKFGDTSTSINVDIAITGSDVYNSLSYINLSSGFTSIGTEDRPFNGTIKITNESLDIFYLTKPFFGVVNQSTSIQNQSGSVRTMKFLCSMGYTGDSLYIPVDYVFANKVVNTTPIVSTPMECSIELTYVSAASGENIQTRNISGLIQTINSNASVKINLTNNGTNSARHVDVTGSGNIGLLCGEMKSDSTLTANIQSGSNTDYSVTSTDSAAGGMVGKMNEGAKLIVPTDLNAGFADITQTVSAATYAGGLVGYAENSYIGTTVPATMYPINMTIGSTVKAGRSVLNGTNGSGHLFGYFKISDVDVPEVRNESNEVTAEAFISKNCTITLSGISSLSVTAQKGNAGGLIGILDFASTAETSAENSPVFIIDGGAGVVSESAVGTQNLSLSVSGDNSGGLIGTYKTSDLKNTLEIKNVYTELSGTSKATTGGLIGNIDDTDNAAYVQIHEAHTKGSKGGGLIGTAGITNTKGAFVDVSGYNKVHGASTGGLISSMANGVLRLSGTTDLSGLTSGNMILNSRDTALVYSNGSGNSNDSTWVFKRPSIANDDIGTWGEVLRQTSANGLSGIVSETNFATAHTVSIAEASTSPSSKLALATLALNIQHNTTNSSAALVMSSTSTSKSSSLLGATLTLCTADLSNTGILGLTRDGGSSPQEFTGSISGGTITLGIGEAYGVVGGTEGTGRIYYHRWSGLLSAINGATISGLTVSGICDKKPSTKDSTSYFGGIAAVYQGSTATSFTTVTSSVNCSIPGCNNNSIAVIGGMIGGVANDATGALSFDGCNSSAKISDGTGVNNYFGGYIALVDRKGKVDSGSIPSISINFGNTTKCTIGGGTSSALNYSNSTAKTRPIYGGLIGAVRGTNAHSKVTTINVSNVEVNSLIINSSLSGDSPNGACGLLGYAWYDSEVDINKLIVTNSSSNTATGGSGDLGGLVYAATGHWTVCDSGENDTVNMSSVSFSGAGSLGLLVTRSFNEVYLGKDDEDYTADKKAALYLELKDQTKYDPSGATITGATVFDELVAYSKNPDMDITHNNGHSIVSINTDGSGTGVTMTGSACNTYQNKTVYGKNTVKTNGNTRYYYNLDTIRTGTPSNAEKLLLWSVQKYAHKSIADQNYFGTSFAPTGTAPFDLNMEGLSYYTIDYDSTFPYDNKGFSLTFYNSEIETGEGVASSAGNTDGNSRSTVNTSSQHYMLHCGLFRNATSNTVRVGSVTLSGNVGKLSDGSGFIICGTLGGDDNVSSKFSAAGITLSGAYINGETTGYAPLVINKVRKNTTLDIKNVRSSGYAAKTGTASNPTTWYAASSLIGEVGNDDESDSNMILDFSSIALDARKTADDVSDSFDTVYGSTRTIFSRATLLNHFIYSGTDSKGTYNYRWSEDWHETVASAPHLVTYGAEIDNTVDHRNSSNISEQLNYFGSSYYTHPSANKSGSPYGSFAANYRPYVYSIGSSNSDNIHELRINIPVTNLTQGCGTYNDPYVIDDPKQLYSVADLIRNTNFTDGDFEINLPSTGISGNRQWCDYVEDDEENIISASHNVFKLNSASTPQFTDGTTTYSREAVRQYLAGAYYQIAGNLELANNFPGLGAGASGEYAFHGVVIGKNLGSAQTPSYPTVTLTAGVPFVYNSNGCVIKNLEFVKGSFTLAKQNTKAQFLYDGGCLAYGGIINKIMGGDNIIDHVGVTMNAPSDAESSGNSYKHIVPVGGYVGVIFNGGLFFRNMNTVTNKTGITAYSTDANKMYLYRNPIIGRVLNGYAVCEDCTKLANGDKNYYISELDSSKAKLSIGSNSITANNAQSWFVLSLLVNSGTMSDKTLYIGADSKSRHLGDYTNVGCLNELTSSEISSKDQLIFAVAETGTVEPYLMYNYTNNAYWLSTSTGYAITMGGGTWTLDKGYRGIGGFNGFDTGSAITGIAATYNCNSECVIKVSGIIGNSTTINLDMKHLGYRHEVKTANGTYAVTQDNYSTTENGFGLFNLFSPLKDGVTVENIALSGTIYSDYVDKDTGEVFHDYPDSKNNWNAYYALTITNSRRLSTGLFAGTKPDTSKTYKVTLSNVSLNSATVHSGKHAGGFIGNASNVTLSNCPATNVSSFGRSSVGGLIGYASDSSKISGASGGTAVSINTVTEQAKGYSNTTGKEGRYSGVGGLVGMSTAITIENINLSSVVGGLVEYDNLGSDDSSYVGGILGMSRGAITIENCSVNKISALGRANRVGGLAGGTLGNQTLTATNVTIDGGSTATLTCAGKESVGGVIGYSSSTVSLTDVTIKNYIIQKNDIYESSANAMGGLVGSLYSDLNMKNVLIANCTLEKIGTSGSNPNLAAGGIIGRVDTSKTIKGYNIVLRDISLNATLNSDGKYEGNFIGVNTPSYKVVGLSLQGTLPTDKLINNTTTNPTVAGSSNKYIIFSDYNGTNIPDPSGATDAIKAGSGSAPKLDNSTVTMVDVKSPFATVNPRVDIDSATQLTGDGMAANAASLPIQTILADKDGVSDPNYKYTVTPTQTSFNDNLSDFNTEWGEAQLANNFAVMNVETLSHDDSHTMINSYLQYLTNTNYNFGTNISNVYRVDIYKMQLENGVFVKKTSGVHLKKDSENRFYMAGGEDVDTAEGVPTFSLIDVTFYDPTNVSNVAYHLYVPVIAKKMLKYTFELATGSGTPYDYAWYSTNGRFASNKMLAENIGSAGTLYFKYTYQRTKKEWQTALDYGEDFLSNFDKVLSMSPINTESENLKSFPAGTQLVLVDANRRGKAYYSTVGTAVSGNNLTLYSKTNPKTYKFYDNGGTDGFEPIHINDLLYITAASSSSGKYAVWNSGDSKDATVEAYLNGTKTKFRVAESSDNTKYNLTVVNSMDNKDSTANDTDTIAISERYYLSIFTDKANYAQGAETPTEAKPALSTVIHYYTVTSGSLTGGPAHAKYVTTPDAKQVLFANLFEQNNVTYYTVNPNPSSDLDPQEINSVTNSVKVALDTKIQLTPQASSAISGQLSSIDMFHSFLVYLTKNEGSSHERAIQGNPTAYADITISSNNGTTPPSTLTHSNSNAYANVGMDYVEVTSNTKLGSFISGGTDENPAIATIHADVVIAYDSPAKQAAQFPAHTGNAQTDAGKYANVSAYSNIGFEEGKTALSKNQETAVHKTGENDYHYFTVSQEEPTLDFYSFSSDGQRYGQLGINANDLSDNTGKVHISAAADFDVRPIASTVKNATHVKFTLTLQKKQQKNSFNYTDYEQVDSISAYLCNVQMELTDVTKTADTTTYTFIVPRSKVTPLDNVTDGKTNYMRMPISFDVYTGTDKSVDDSGNVIDSFERRGLLYANYKVTVSAQMLNSEAPDNGAGTSASGELIYTNAKLLGDYIK